MTSAGYMALVGGGAKLPYDAEVEYLESTGMPWIDTGIYHITKNPVYFKIQLPKYSGVSTASSKNTGCYKAYIDNKSACSRLIRNDNQGFTIRVSHGVYVGNETLVSMKKGGVDQHVLEGYTEPGRLRFPGMSAYIADDVELHPPDADELATPFVFFAPNISTGGRIYYFKVENQCDFIPVRIGTEGAMYDRVSGQLFRNKGTGAFVIGPDVSAVSRGGGVSLSA